MFALPLKPLCFLVVPATVLALAFSAAVAAAPDPAPLSPLNQVFIPVVVSGHVAHALVIDEPVHVKSQDDGSPETVDSAVDQVRLPSIGTPPQIPVPEALASE